MGLAKMRWAIAAMAVGALSFVPSPAYAEPPRDQPADDAIEQLGGQIEMGVAARREAPPPPVADGTLGPEGAMPATGPRDVASLSPMVRLHLRVRDEVELFGAAGVVSVISNGPQGKDSTVRPSNITFGGRRVWEWGQSEGKYRAADAGLTFGIPTGYARTDDELSAYEYALAGRGGLDPWEWMPQTLAFAVPGGVSAQLFKRWVVSTRGALAAMLPSQGDVSKPTIAAQASAGARFVLPWLGVGVRGSAVYNGRHPDDKSQVAITPSLDTNLCRRGGRRISGTMAPTTARCPVSLTAQLNLNLDAPYGFVTDDAMGIWGLHFGLGWAIF